jgi:hypothetical protein
MAREYIDPGISIRQTGWHRDPVPRATEMPGFAGFSVLPSTFYYSLQRWTGGAALPGHSALTGLISVPPGSDPGRPAVHLSRPHVRLSRSDVLLSRPYVHLSRPDVRLSRPDVRLGRPHVRLSRPDVRQNGF